MGTTGIFISRNIKFKILPSINASLSDFTGFFALKTNQKIACVDFRGKITTKVYRNSERYHLTSLVQARNQDFVWGGANETKVDQTTEIK